jgi:hypothetical protein
MHTATFCESLIKSHAIDIRRLILRHLLPDFEHTSERNVAVERSNLMDEMKIPTEDVLT